MATRIKINGIDFAAEDGESVLSAVSRFGIEVPTLCHHEAVEDIGACRICLVELRQGLKTEVTTACNAKVAEGLEVTCDTEAVRKNRTSNLEMLLARAPKSKRVRELALQYGVHESRFVPEDSQGLDGCILCELCVRVCETLGHNALATVGRGGQKRIAPPFDQAAESCVGCAACLSVCPTDCIPMEQTKHKRHIWNQDFEMVACETCGGPVITVKQRDHAIEKVDLPADYYTRCTACKKANLSQRFAQVGVY